MLKSKLQISVDVYRKLTERSSTRGRVSGKASPEESRQFIAELEKAGIEIVSCNADGTFTFAAPSAQDEFFASTFGDLIAGESRKKKCPSAFYVAELDYLHDSETTNKPEQIAGYLDAINLIQALSSIADHGTEQTSTKLVFFHKQKIELRLSYTAESIKPIPKLAQFKEIFLNDAIHIEQKKTIIKSVLLELSTEFEGQPLSIDLLIGRFEELFRRVASGYQLYVSEFSFQKVKAEVEKSKFEFITRINKVFSDIQNQLLAVPAALIIAGSQFESARTFNLKNSMIYGGVLAFTIFMILLIINQKNTLKSIFNEIDNEWLLIKKKHDAIKAQFNEQYLTLETRYKYQCVLLELVALIVVSACITTTALFLYHSSSDGVSIEAYMVLGFFWIVYVMWRCFSLLNILMTSSKDSP